MIILDTHAWIWWTSDPHLLSRRAAGLLKLERHVGVPAICCWEFARLVARRRVSADRGPLDWIKEALAVSGVELLPVTPAVAVQAAQLPDSFPGDPCDRLIVATALVEGATLLTKDRRILESGLVDAVW